MKCLCITACMARTCGDAFSAEACMAMSPGALSVQAGQAARRICDCNLRCVSVSANPIWLWLPSTRQPCISSTASVSPSKTSHHQASSPPSLGGICIPREWCTYWVGNWRGCWRGGKEAQRAGASCMPEPCQSILILQPPQLGSHAKGKQG